MRLPTYLPPPAENIGSLPGLDARMLVTAALPLSAERGWTN